MESTFNEKLILQEISTVTNLARSFTAGVERVRATLEREAGLRSLFTEIFESGSELEIRVRQDELQPLFELEGLPYKFVYSVGLRSNGRDLGRLVLAFAYASFPGDAPRRVATFAGEQLGILLARTRLAERRAAAQRKLDDLRDRLAEDKVLTRAEGLLTSRYHYSAAAAKQWLAAQGRKKGLTAAEVAERLINLHATTGTHEAPGLPLGLRPAQRLSA